MALRNFWIETDIDGRRSNDATGPRAKDGGFNVSVYVNDGGESTYVVRVAGLVRQDGTLRIVVEDKLRSEFVYDRDFSRG